MSSVGDESCGAAMETRDCGSKIAHRLLLAGPVPVGPNAPEFGQPPAVRRLGQGEDFAQRQAFHLIECTAWMAAAKLGNRLEQRGARRLVATEAIVVGRCGKRSIHVGSHSAAGKFAIKDDGSLYHPPAASARKDARSTGPVAAARGRCRPTAGIATCWRSWRGRRRRKMHRAHDVAWETTIEPRGLLYHLERYAEENPRNAALCCCAVGFFLGWRLKPW